MELRAAALEIVHAALAAADPAECVRRAIGRMQKDAERADRIIVVGAGKAAAPMAQALERALGERIHAGWVNTKYGHGVPLESIVCHECGHPVPDQAGVEGAHRIAALAQSARKNDLVIALISGGASALLPFPAEPITLDEKQEATRLLLASGAAIHEFNTVRKHLSAIKGGRLAQMAAPAKVIALILSDVIGDDLDVIGSGPTAPDASTFDDARNVLKQRRAWHSVAPAVREFLTEAKGESPKPGDPLFRRVENVIVGSNRLALAAAQNKAIELGCRTLLLASGIQGETRDIAGMHAAILREIRATGNPIASPACILSGGETTVTMSDGGGKGGRNQEFALAAALDIAGLDQVLVLSFGTDGTDGPTDAAGAIADGATLRRAIAVGLDPAACLRRHDSYPLFAALGDLVITGPTRTNVMDVHILLSAH